MGKNSFKYRNKKKKETFATSKAGITGIMRTVETKARETDKTIQQAFTDINALMEKAKDLVLLAEKFATQQSKESKNEDTELRSVLISMGISSPVTKESAGSLYHNQLSRQLADWLQKPLQKFGGIIALTDLYCIFNRARGTEMISPDDLYRACMLFEELKLPVRLRKFESGVLVVQSINETDNIIAKQIADLVRVDGPQTAFDIAKTKNISLALATEELLTAEKQGLICRDETYEGLVYYLNFFNDINLVKLYIK
jgi:ESCRT-II complex subunit VPS36